MSYLKTILLLIVISTFSASALYAQANDRNETLVKQLKERDQQIKELLSGHEGNKVEGELKDKLTKLINETIDLKQMGKLALGDESVKFSEDELAEFYSLFSEMVRTNSIKNLDIYKATITYEEVTETDKQLIVQTVSSLDNISTPVYYTFINVDNKWVIADFAIDNVSTAMSYRRSFSRLIAKRGVDGLLNVLRKKVSSED
jgi:phospholipid transport system substrate-binding protein